MNKFLELLKKVLTEGKIEDAKYTELEVQLKLDVTESEKGLRDNRDIILNEKKAAAKELGELKTKFEKVDAEEYARLVEEEEDRKIRLEAGEGEGDENESTLKKEIAEQKIELVKLQKKYERETKEAGEKFEAVTVQGESYKTLLFGASKITALDKAFDDFNIKTEHRAILKDALSTRTKVEIDDEGKLAVSIVGDDDVPLPVDDYFKSWSVTESAKPYIGVKANKGGGAGGGTGTGDGTEVQTTKQAYEDAFGKTQAAS